MRRTEAKVTARRSRRRFGLVVGIVVVVALGLYVPASLLAPAPASAGVATTYTAPSQAATSVDLPSYGGSAIEAVGYKGSLVTHDPSTPRSIASISKIVTALVVLQKKPLNGGNGPTITITPTEQAYYKTYLAQDGEVATMTVGQKLTERQVLEVALIKSANNYATTLAIWAYGSIPAYRAAAATWLKQHALDHTTINEPTGLDFKNKSTPTDLLTLGRLALANTDVATIVSTAETTVPGVGEIENSNGLLGKDGVVGIKTGTLDKVGANLLFATKQEVDGHEVELIGVVLGGPDHDTIDTAIGRMLAQVTAKFHVVTAVSKGAVYGTYATPWGATARAATTRSASKLVYGTATVSAHVKLDHVAVRGAGAHVGTIRVTIGSSTTTVPLALDGPIEAPSAWWRLTNPRATFGGAEAAVAERF
ncbi:D-alanyl-D-alanine carboxypeptidase family protein [Frondihabitans australicus]|uniref:D-alanyl-D-alanine carboxypeptidase (Penicillin-binding protein 5/6) n=1 Tax=Frondihabitans australicus TaxID=386892 RepID=A0A495IDZ6_9MICO|nr:D-alanyl-D-alanine carboxypeptidase [Frondihabitans australicus]RKR74212.1 D-alanyl-D-alanine carboxypeptidase (penicillin-binding protein 5/6) [Frondihabitans australicus]